MAKRKFYTVWKGRETGVFDNWDECNAQVKGFSGAKFESFKTRKDAEDAFTKGGPDPDFNNQLTEEIVSEEVPWNEEETNHSTKINYVQGDATYPIGNGTKIIVHVCNDVGAWGKGFVLAISKRWKAPEVSYKGWYRLQTNFFLGQVQFVLVESDIHVANIIGQRNIRKDKQGVPPIRYEAIRMGLQQVAVFAKMRHASIHMPRIGCGLAGGTWETISSIIEKELVYKGISVTVYDLP